jgi:hypothetical protein
MDRRTILASAGVAVAAGAFSGVMQGQEKEASSKTSVGLGKMQAACTACAKACDACATECEKMKSDEQMVSCAKACRDCAESCRKMA